MYDFGDPDFPTEQVHTSDFGVGSDGWFDSFICWIVVDTGVPLPRSVTTRRQKARVSVTEEAAAVFAGLRAYTGPGYSFTTKDGSSTSASAWERPCVLLPFPTQVFRGDVIRVRAETFAATLRPHYSFTVWILRQGALVWETQVQLSYQDVRPVYWPLK